MMRNSPDPIVRAIEFGNIPIEGKYITIEPIMDFDMASLVEMVLFCKPQQVNIGADSQKKNLPEPDAGKIRELITEIMMFTTVELKKNLDRILTFKK